MDVTRIATDLAAEQRALDAIVASLSPPEWDTATPSPRWTVAHQIAHLTYFDRAAAIAITDSDRFQGMVNDLLEAIASGGDEGIDRLTLDRYLSMPRPELLGAWRDGRALLAAAAGRLADDCRIHWYGPSTGAKSFLTARLMEVWAHGQDVVDALGADRPATDRLKHIAQLGFITRSWSYINRGRPAPAEPVRLELVAPSGGTWRFGPDDADESVIGPALDFCLVVTQRRHLDDTVLSTTPLARDWLLVAQAFAGAATDGPLPGTRRASDTPKQSAGSQKRRRAETGTVQQTPRTKES